MTLLLVVGCSVLGLVVGWLVDPVITRVPRRLPVRGPAEAEVPTSPPVRRWTVAIVCGVLFGALALKFHDSWVLPAYLVLGLALVVLAVIDLEHYLLPNRIVYPLTVCTLVLLALAAVAGDDGHALVRALLSGCAAFGAFLVLHLISPRSMGFGDVKLSFVLGVALGWLGWAEVLVGLFLGFVYGAVIGVSLIVLRIRRRDQAVPFGPFLAAGALTAILAGDAIVRWYRGG